MQNAKGDKRTVPLSPLGICQEVSRSGSSGKQRVGFSPGKREPKELLATISNVIEEYRNLPEQYPMLKVYYGAKDMHSGANHIRAGVELLLCPAPTVLDDLVGVGCIAYGILECAGGFVKTLVGFKQQKG